MTSQEEKRPNSNENIQPESDDNIQNAVENVPIPEEEEQISEEPNNQDFANEEEQALYNEEEQPLYNEEEQEIPVDGDDNNQGEDNGNGDDDYNQGEDNGDDDDDDYYNYKQVSTGDTPDTFDTSTGSTPIDEFSLQVIPMINVCRAYLTGFVFQEYLGKTIDFKIPTSILPLSISVFNGFNNDPILVEASFEVDKSNPWRKAPFVKEVENPTHKKSFPGSIILQDRIKNFFSNDYKPKKQYRCHSYVLAPQNKKNPENYEDLVKELLKTGFEKIKCQRALEFCSFDLDKARDYLISGILEPTDDPLPLEYREFPLFYLVLEICECFFDMCYCCCNCGKDLGVFSLRPFCCDDERCIFSFTKIGVGANVLGEIRRDPLATDFLISLASAAFHAPPTPPVFDPRPPEKYQNRDLEKFFKALPSMSQICRMCQNDKELISFIGLDHFYILRYFILMNEAQLITLEKTNQVKINKYKGYQFLASFVSPESELKFIEKKKKHGVKWFWHGSLTPRWYRIMHTGLKDFGNTQYQVNAGPIYGTGIYMSDSFNYSYWYCRPDIGHSCMNYYAKSVLPKNFIVMALTENAAVPGLSKTVHENEFTQKDEEACITRVLFLMDVTKGNDTVQFNTLATPPIVPSLSDVLKEKMSSVTPT